MGNFQCSWHEGLKRSQKVPEVEGALHSGIGSGSWSEDRGIQKTPDVQCI